MPTTHPISRPLAWLDQAPRAALFLDLGGTLVDTAATPEEVGVPPGLPDLLHALHDQLDGAVAILTGRPITDIDRLLGATPVPVVGLHGAEYRTADDVRPAALPLDDTVVAALRAVAERSPGARFEHKGASAAIHWRAAPERTSEIEAAIGELLAAPETHLELRPGRRAFEIVPRHVSKGAALEVLAGLERFAGRRPIMIGDDHGDVSAFEAAERLGGVGLRVAGEAFAAEAADFASPRQVREWLSMVLVRCRAATAA